MTENGTRPGGRSFTFRNLSSSSSTKVSVPSTVIESRGVTLTKVTEPGLRKVQPTTFSLNLVQNKPSPLAENQPTNYQPSTSHDVNSYKRMDHRQHVYERPDTYIGSDIQSKRITDVLDFSGEGDPQVVKSEIFYPKGAEQLFLEVLTNAGDNVSKSRTAGIDPGVIRVKADKQRITVRNNGLIIPIEIHPGEKVYAAEMILGTLLTSSNYDDKQVRHVAGRNGYGAKITNVFSVEFTVKIGDPNKGLCYEQRWETNMTVCHKPIITSGYKGKAFVEVSYVMEHGRFGYTEYPDEAICLFARHCVDESFIQQVTVYFNGIELKARSMASYTKYYFGKDAKFAIHYEWPAGTEIIKKRGGIQVAKDSRIMPILELSLIDTPNIGRIIAFCNGLITPRGGIHIDSCLPAVQKPILDRINKSIAKPKGKTQAISAPRLTATEFKRHVSMIITCRLDKPRWDAQGKGYLIGYGRNSRGKPHKKIPITIKDDWFNSIGNWELISQLQAELEAKMERKLALTDGKRRRRPKIGKLKDANDAGRGKAKSANCTLVLTEGDSAEQYATKLFGCMGPKFRDTYGFYPLRGKFLNVREADNLKIANNLVITSIKHALGLQEKLDYAIPANRAKLRYGKVMIITDPDVDGHHILGLVINYFDCRFRSLLQNGMISYNRIPLIRAVRLGKKTEKFYTMAEANKWEEKSDSDYRQRRYRYFKGLGSSNNMDIADDFKDMYVVHLNYDTHAKRYIDVLFRRKGRKAAAVRKALIERYRPDRNTVRYSEQPISHLMQYTVLSFSVADVQRSIPAFSDGLKDVQRKIIYATFNHWGNTCKKTKNVKVDTFSGSVSALTAYQHGQISISKAIVGMAQDFTGSNNLPFLFPDGQFGSRDELGKNAAAGRYLHTYPQWWLPLVFRPEDEPLLKRRIDEGNEREYIRYKPILPVSLFNGISGIGTGFSTRIPPYNIIDISAWLMLRIRGLTTKGIELDPWYRGFKGTINVAPQRSRKKSTISDEEEEIHLEIIDMFGNVEENFGEDHEYEYEPDESEHGTRRRTNKRLMSCYTTGLFNPSGNDVIISELPIERGINAYKNWLDTLIENNIITEAKNNSLADVPLFTVTGMKSPTIQKLRLERSFPMSNMALLDDNDRPHYYSTVEDILETFYLHRLRDYEQRKTLRIEEIKTELKNIDDKMRLIQAIIEKDPVKKLRIKKRSKVAIHARMDELELNVPYNLLGKIHMYNLTEDELVVLQDKYQQKLNELAAYRNIPASQIWEEEIVKFIAAYLKHYPKEIHRLSDKNLLQTPLAPFAAKAKPSFNLVNNKRPGGLVLKPRMPLPSKKH